MQNTDTTTTMWHEDRAISWDNLDEIRYFGCSQKYEVCWFWALRLFRNLCSSFGDFTAPFKARFSYNCRTESIYKKTTTLFKGMKLILTIIAVLFTNMISFKMQENGSVWDLDFNTYLKLQYVKPISTIICIPIYKFDLV